MTLFYIYIFLWVVGFLYLTTVEYEVLNDDKIIQLMPDWINKELIYYAAVILGNMLLMGFIAMLNHYFKYIKEQISIWIIIRKVKKILKKHKIKL